MIKNFLSLAKAYLVVWIWKPTVSLLVKLFSTKDCCNNPNWVWHEGHGFSIRYCYNCKNSQTYPRNF